MEAVSETMRTVPLNWYLYLSTVLFSIGVAGVLLRRNAIVIFMSIELMLNSVNLLLAAFSAYSNNPTGQVFVFFIMVVAAAEVAVGLAILVMIYRNSKTTDINSLNNLKW
ncbi:MAG: NADH-quinone oxidoreductase subunit NuoK [Bacteroidia bacterium]|nr:NADH-quinone oxidoreductase subunit NuoK [Bacteroidia bacterium]